ncbi:MAG: 23S rRNA pseudouridine(2604) synthase RluF [Candidatus Saccharimonadaceae bacterium]
MTELDSTRLNKYISESGFCSRREADKFIEAKNVFINGKIAQLGDRVKPKDKVRVNGIEIEPRPKDEAIYILFNKPTGVTSTTDTSDKDNIIDYIRYGERIFPVGRLDKDSQGLIILTSNGDIVNKILRAGNQHEKEYVVTVDKPVTPQFVESMSSGVPILGVNTRKCKIHAESKFIFRITLIQGMNRQIRRMCENFGYNVIKLERVRIMNLSVKGIPLGDYREMKPKELEELQELIQGSETTIDPLKMTKTPGLKDPERSMHIARSLQSRTAPSDEIPKKKRVDKTTPASNPKSVLNRKSTSSRTEGAKRFASNSSRPNPKFGGRSGSAPKSGGRPSKKR